MIAIERQLRIESKRASETVGRSSGVRRIKSRKQGRPWTWNAQYATAQVGGVEFRTRCVVRDVRSGRFVHRIVGHQRRPRQHNLAPLAAGPTWILFDRRSAVATIGQQLQRLGESLARERNAAALPRFFDTRIA